MKVDRNTDVVVLRTYRNFYIEILIRLRSRSICLIVFVNYSIEFKEIVV